MSDPWVAIQAFCLSYELGNFTVAAHALAVTPQAVSRAVARLERRVGTVLFRRSTRHLEPTEAGRAYYEACRSALDTLSTAEDRLAGARAVPSGEVRVSVPTTYGHQRFLPMLPAFCRRYPQVQVDVEISNRTIDFVREGFDVAVRMGTLGDASFVARRLGDFSLGVFGSPSYLEAAGIPEDIEDLKRHACAVFSMPRTGRPLPWTFQPEPESLIPEAAVRIRHDVTGLITFAMAGGGLIQIYHYLVEEALAQGQLREVLKPYAGRARPFSLLYPRDAVRRPAVRALVDHVMEASAGDRST